MRADIQTTAGKVRVSFRPGNIPPLLWVTRPESGMWECWGEPAMCFWYQSSVTQRTEEPSVGLRSRSRKTLDVIAFVPVYERLVASSAAVIQLTTPRGGCWSQPSISSHTLARAWSISVCGIDMLRFSFFPESMWSLSKAKGIKDCRKFVSIIRYTKTSKQANKENQDHRSLLKNGELKM